MSIPEFIVGILKWIMFWKLLERYEQVNHLRESYSRLLWLFAYVIVLTLVTELVIAPFLLSK